ncbi:exodeoxyribonuclease VII large subunit [Metabacillus sp. GX 13764]|uniref:exodeoxyribonuclease VII large subunit n=1 Tax=Metabacillus kandeliae TaxID=2900151 RepID=UPI001E48AA29|nr:exodeoxyribonuclease VII large subunit [Metabacillus kandeliae]MCD7033209.1 exodeoxyribonuclease VII large subunit [Metabacillus kandeliae]
MSEVKYVTVRALTKYIKRKFDVDPHLHDIWVKGELSNVKIHSRGHIYFTLKDEDARILGVMFSSQNKSLKFRPENGMKVMLRGEISVYEASGQYQIYAKEMQPDGIGSLYLAYEELKKKLQQKGYFDEKHKKTIPAFPRQVGVITSPTGAAIRDILTTINRRFPMAKVILIPALVQGVQAGRSVASAIQQANNLNDLDVLIVGRGGGSIEELWAFNEEIVAEAIFQSRIPLISAVGHETDFTIADFVADLRAPTPTAAAELAVPHFAELAERISARETRLMRAIQEKVTHQKDRLQSLRKSYAFRYPKQLYEQKEQQLDLLTERLQKETLRAADKKRERYLQSKNRLKQVHPSSQIKRSRADFEQWQRKLQREMQITISQKQTGFSAVLAKLNALNPLAIMERGYSVVYKEEKLIKKLDQVEEGDRLKVMLQDGYVHAEVRDKERRNNE